MIPGGGFAALSPANRGRRRGSGIHMDQRTNAQVIEAVYQAFSTGDLAAFDAYTDDSVWDEAGLDQRTGV